MARVRRTCNTISFKPKALKQLQSLPDKEIERILGKVDELKNGLTGGVKHLKGAPGYRLRVGDYRVLFTMTGAAVEVYRVGHRKDVYEQ